MADNPLYVGPQKSYWETTDEERAVQAQMSRTGIVPPGFNSSGYRAAPAQIQTQGPSPNADLEELERLGLMPGKPPGFDTTYRSYLGDLNQKLGAINYDQSGLNAFKERALGQGPSPWAHMMTEQQGLNQTRALGSAAAQAQSGLTGAMSAIAQRGGLSAGARERTAMRSTRDLNQMRQDIYGRGAQERLGIGIEDEKMRTNMLGQLPGMQNQAYQSQLAGVNLWANMANADRDAWQRDMAAKNQFNQDIWGKQLGAYGAVKSGQIMGRYA